MQPEINYKEALKLGQKEVRARAAKNENTALAVLDELIPPEQALSGIALGVIQIPMWFIVGTKTAGRVNAFAPNFMPLLPESTEFAAKWESLYRSHMTEGIRESVKVYEYLNRYYVEEGNKRVSVLKYCGAYSIPADVIRIMPEKTDSEEVQLYLEYLEFNRYSKINFIEFSKRGSYRELLRAMGKPFDEYWSIDEQQRFSSAYYFFERAYTENGGDKLKTTVGDAMLSYIQVYGYAQLQNDSEAQIRINLKKMWEEIALKEEDDAIELKTVPVEEKKQSVISKVLPITKPQKLKAAFIYDVPPEKSGWVSDHETGRKHAQTVLGDKVETEVYICGGEGNYPDVLEQAIGEGCRLIFTT